MNFVHVTYFDSSEVEYIPKESKEFIGNRNITRNIHRIHANESIMFRYFCNEFISFMLTWN